MIKNENYIQICGWMLNELNLKGTELLIYALIYGFSQDGNSVFNGSLTYISDWTNTSKQAVINCLDSLLEKKLIEKNVIYENNQRFCEYKAIKPFNEDNNTQQIDSQKSLIPQSKNLTTPSQKSLIPQSKNLTTPSQKSLPNNLINTNDNTTYTSTDSVETNKNSKEEVFLNIIKKIFGYNPGFDPNPYPELIINLNNCNVPQEYLEEYLTWVFEILKKTCKNQANFAGYFYKSFTKEFHISTFWHKKQADLKKKQQKESNLIICPVCDTKHDKTDLCCPGCSCNEDILTDSEVLKKEKAIWNLKNNNPIKYQNYTNELEILWNQYPFHLRFNNVEKQAEFEQKEKEIENNFLYQNLA